MARRLCPAARSCWRGGGAWCSCAEPSGGRWSSDAGRGQPGGGGSPAAPSQLPGGRRRRRQPVRCGCGSGRGGGRRASCPPARWLPSLCRGLRAAEPGDARAGGGSSVRVSPGPPRCPGFAGGRRRREREPPRPGPGAVPSPPPPASRGLRPPPPPPPGCLRPGARALAPQAARPPPPRGSWEPRARVSPVGRAYKEVALAEKRRAGVPPRPPPLLARSPGHVNPRLGVWCFLFFFFKPCFASPAGRAPPDWERLTGGVRRAGLDSSGMGILQAGCPGPGGSSCISTWTRPLIAKFIGTAGRGYGSLRLL